MNIESSRISTIFNSGESDGPARVKSTFKGAANTTFDPKKKKQSSPTAINPNDLNNWEICDPDKLEDRLPQPFRLINKLIYKTILGNVNRDIEKIDKAKLSHNYEKRVKEIIATNFFDFGGISCFANHKTNPTNSLLVGDKSGNVLLLDLNKRALTTRKEIVPERRIIDISAVTIPFEDTYLTTFSVISHATQEVFIYQYKLVDHTMKPLYSIRCAKNIQTINNETEVGEFPFKAVISSEGSYISIILYNGNVEVYKIPEPLATPKGGEDQGGYVSFLQPGLQVPPMNAPTKVNNSAVPAKGLEKGAPQLQTQAQTPAQLLAANTIELFPVKKIMLKAPEVEKDPREVLLSLLCGPPEVDPNVQLEKAKEANVAARDKKPPVQKGKEAPQLVKEETKPIITPIDLLKKEYMQNPIKTFKELRRSSEGDNSEYVEPPLYYPDIYYLQTPVIVQDTSQKQFSFEKVVDLTSDMICVWRQTNTFDIYELEKVTIEHVPAYIIASVFKPVDSIANRSDRSSINSLSIKADQKAAPKPIPVQPPVQPKVVQQQNAEATVLSPVYSFDMIYPIACSSISKNSTFLSLGLQDGTIIIWDVGLNQQKFVLDKHRLSVTVVSFYEDWRLISGSKDGTVHLYDLQDKSNNIKYQHVFQVSGNSIVEIGVNDAGVAFALDNQRNLRAYDLFHFQKIFKVFPVDPRGKDVSFSLWPLPLLNVGKEQLCIISDEITKGGETQNDWSRKRCILIYRILDNLISTFPGLANLIKKGIDKSKAIIAFSKLGLADLNNPNFDIPLLETLATSKKQIDFKSTSNSAAQSSRSQQKNRSSSRGLPEPTLSDLNHTYVSVEKGVNRKTSPGGQLKKGILTHANLHPEKYLTEKPNFPKAGVVNPTKKTMDTLREINQEKASRTEKLQQYNNQIQEELDRKEEMERLQKRKQMLKETGH